MENFTSNSQVHRRPIARLWTYLFVLIFSFHANAQQELSTSDKKAKKLYEKAEKDVKERDFESALNKYQQAIARDENFYEAYLRTGMLYNMMGNLDSVYTNFSTYAQLSLNPSQSVLRRLAFMALERGQYKSSEVHLVSLLKRNPELKSDKEIVLLQQSLTFAQEQILKEHDFKIEKLPEQINRFQLQYLPVLTVDNATMMFTKRDYTAGDEDIVVSYFRNNEWTTAQSVSKKINSSLNEGACTISADGLTMILTSCDRRDSFGSCDLYIARKRGEDWSKPQNLGKSINTHYWESQPSLSADGKTLYFSSNRPGGYGGRDLWVSHHNGKGWEKPINLGVPINSFKDETTPFIHANNETLYFSSNGRVGMGGYDLFKTELGETSWSIPQNLGFSINTFKDEVALMIASDGMTGFFAQENQKNNEIIDSDIVSFTLPEEFRADRASYIIGRVIDKQTRKPLAANIQVADIENSNLLYSNKSDSLSGEYLMVLPTGKKLAGYVKKKGYLFQDFEFNSSSSSLLKPDTILIELSKVEAGKSIVLHNIYFEIDSYTLDSRSDSEIESVVELMIENPEIKVEISGHTDNTGSREHNQTLSQNRAKTVYAEMIKKGIDSSRLSFKGYADEKPIYPNTNDFNRQSNRRIEFSVIRLK